MNQCVCLCAHLPFFNYLSFFPLLRGVFPAQTCPCWRREGKKDGSPVINKRSVCMCAATSQPTKGYTPKCYFQVCACTSIVFQFIRPLKRRNKLVGENKNLLSSSPDLAVYSFCFNHGENAKMFFADSK